MARRLFLDIPQLSDEWADITSYVLSFPAVVEQAGEFGQLSVIDLPQIQGINRRGFLDPATPSSPFYGTPWLDNYIFVIKEGEDIIYRGRMQDIECDNQNNTATITTNNIFQAALALGVVYSTDTDELTPADVAREICELYEIPIDAASFGVSAGLYAADNVFIRVILTSPSMTVAEVLQSIAEIGCARLYAIGEVMYFEAYQERTTPPVYAFTDNPAGPNGVTIWQHPSVTPIQKESIDGYHVTWAGTPAAAFGEGDAIKELSYGADQPIQIVSLQAAVWIGERWLSYLTRAQNQITFLCKDTLGAPLGVGFPTALDYGGWDAAVVIDIVAIDRSTPGVTQITGVTR